jgi:hypothetical protein
MPDPLSVLHLEASGEHISILGLMQTFSHQRLESVRIYLRNDQAGHL